MEKKKYFMVHSKNLAIVVSYLIGEDFYTFDNKFDETQKVYSFRSYSKAEEAMKIIQGAKEQFS